MMKNQHAISINMPVYNAQKYVADAIKSVLEQTFSDFEFIIMDDGSTDATLDIINSFSDNRIVLIRNEHNFVETLNRGLDRSGGKYIVRMDADDLMHIDRLDIQYAFMEKNPEIDICSSWMQCFNAMGDVETGTCVCGYISDPLMHFLKTNFVFNPTCMIRKEFIDKNALRYHTYRYGGDFKFWCDAAKLGARFYVDSQLLHYYRLSDQQVSHAHKEEQIRNTLEIKKEVILSLIDCEPKPQHFREAYQALSSLTGTDKMTDALFLDFFYKLFAEQKTV